MTEEVTVEGKSYISSKRAAELSEYTQDYIGQLARGGYIDAQRVGGLWYISMDSLNEYKQSEGKEKTPPRYTNTRTDPESLVFFDGKEYISASRASKLCGYTQDYVGQLARGGKILSRQVGNRWYVDKEGIVQHKKEKDALLAAVQKESVGIAPLIENVKEDEIPTGYPNQETHFIYKSEEIDLMPTFPEKSYFQPEGDYEQRQDERHIIPIRIVSDKELDHKGTLDAVGSSRETSGKLKIGRALTFSRPVLFSVAVGISIAASLGVLLYTSNNKGRLRLTSNQDTQVALVADGNASSVIEKIAVFLEGYIAPQIIYKRH